MLARELVIVAAGGYCSFVEAGRWRPGHRGMIPVLQGHGAHRILEASLSREERFVGGRHELVLLG